MQYPWPMAPWIRGWRVRTTIVLTDADRAAIAWLLQQLPGGLPNLSYSLDLAQHWLTWWATESASHPIPKTWEESLDCPPVLVGWWFFVMTMAHSQLWKTLWRAHMQMGTILEINLQVTIPALPHDAHRQQDIPFSRWAQAIHFLTNLSPNTDLASETAVYIAWRNAWWALWRVRAPSMPGTLSPWWGLAPQAFSSVLPTIRRRLAFLLPSRHED